MLFRQIHDPYLSQYAYLIGCQQSGEAIIIDPQRDVDRYFEAAEAEGLRLVAAADTHIHADYLSGLRELADRGSVKIYVSGMDEEWRYEWLEDSGADHQVLHDGDTFRLGNIVFDVVHTPGHTPEHLSYLVIDGASGDSDGMGVLTGDFVFVGDLGRPDLLESAAGQTGKMRPAAKELYRSVQHFRSLPAWMQIWPGHGAGSACGKALGAVPHSTVGYEIRQNASITTAERGEEAFIDSILEAQPEPPFYFKRMKHLNREGPPLLRTLPTPRAMQAGDLQALSRRTDVAVVDTRPRDEYLAAHMPGSLFSPFDSSFCTTVGSYVPAEQPVYLIIEPERLEEAVRCLIRIGYDEVVGFFTPEVAAQYLSDADEVASLETVDFDDVEQRRDAEDALVVDVRRNDEYQAGHVPGAFSAPHTRLLERKDDLPPGKPLIVHCESGVRSAVASAMLQRHGFCVYYVEDEFEHWAAEHEVEGAAEEQA